MIAAGRAPVAKAPRLENIDVDIEPDRLGHRQEEVAEHGSGGPGTDDRNP